MGLGAGKNPIGLANEKSGAHPVFSRNFSLTHTGCAGSEWWLAGFQAAREVVSHWRGLSWPFAAGCRP